jgi:hypothetical protein
MIRVVLPYHLRNLAGVGKEVSLEVGPPVTARSIVDSLEAAYPALRGTIRDQTSLERRPLLRYFACGEDVSHRPDDEVLPAAIADGREAFLIIGAIAGG